MPKISVSRAEEKDREAIIALDRLIVGNSSRSALIANSVERRRCVVAAIDSVPVGYAAIERTFLGQFHIVVLGVHPGYRTRGVSRALVEYVESIRSTDPLFSCPNELNMITDADPGSIAPSEGPDPDSPYARRKRGIP